MLFLFSVSTFSALGYQRKNNFLEQIVTWSFEFRAVELNWKKSSCFLTSGAT